MIVISGPSCVGKTTLGRKISTEFHLPLISRDSIKESLFDTLGSKDREWSRRLGKASYEIMYNIVESHLKVKRPIIIESNFTLGIDDRKISNLQNKYNISILQLVLHADSDVLFDRFKSRAISGERHMGHGDNENSDEFKVNLSKHMALNIKGRILYVDTTSFQDINYETLFNTIRLSI